MTIEDDELASPPDVDSLNPALMTTLELHRSLDSLFGWLHLAEAGADGASADPKLERSIELVREAANLLLNEQRERHSDETAPRGG